MEYGRPEYSSRAEEIQDGWRGTWIGILCVIFIVLSYSELRFADAYYQDGQLVTKSIKLAVILSFSFSLFFIKDATDTSPLDKLRQHLFALMFFSVFSLWIVPFSNRFWLPEDQYELADAYVHKTVPGNNIRFGKQAPGKFDFLKVVLEVYSSEAEKTMINKVAKPEKSRVSIVKTDFTSAEKIQAGQTITVRVTKGRWGQSFIELP